MAKIPEEILKAQVERQMERQRKDEERKKLKAERELMGYVPPPKAPPKVPVDKNKIEIINNDDIEIDNSLIEDVQIKEGETIDFNEITDSDTDKKIIIEETVNENGREIKRRKSKYTPWKRKEKDFFNEQNKNIKRFFFKSVPKYNKYICSCCGLPKPLFDFNKSWSFLNASRTDQNSQMYMSWCKECSKKLFQYYYISCDRNEELAMEKFCCETNIYWDIECYRDAKKILENNNRKLNIVSEYIAAVGRDRVLGKTYWDSPTIKNRNITIIHGKDSELETKLVYNQGILNNGTSSISASTDTFNTPLDWEREDALNRAKIIKTLRYDPFDDETEEDKKSMYRSLEIMMDEAMQDDYVKLSAAIEVVRSFHKIEEWRKKVKLLEKGEGKINEIKELSTLKKNELELITKFSRDHGFAERYGQKKAKGAGSLSGCMQEMKETYYENGILNLYDIKTSESMKKSAEMSIEAIFKQLSLGENDSYHMLKKQTEKIRTLQQELDKTQEQLRLANIKIEGKKLLDKQKKDDDGDYYD